MQQLNILDEMQDNQVVEDLEEVDSESNGWETYRLADACTKIGSGATPTGGKEAYLQDGPISLIRSQNILDFSFSYDGLAYINEEQAKKLDNVKIEERDILLNITGDSVARVCQVPKQTLPARVNQHVAIIRPNKEKLNPEYLKYHLLNPQYKNFMLGLSSSGATRNALTKVMIENFVITCPKIIEQEKIAKILSSLDDKIELNQKMNKTLEEMAQAIFKHWFIDFEFPNEEGKPYKSSGGEMVDSELGEIPKGWEMSSLDKIATFLNGLPLQKFRPIDNSYLPVIKIRELKQGITKNTEKASTEIDKKYIIDNGDLLFSWSGSLEVDFWCHGKAALNQHLFKVFSDEYPKWFYYFWNNYYLPKFKTIAAGKATTMGHIQRHNLTEAIVLIPDKNTLDKMTKIIEPIIERRILNSIEAGKIIDIRDSLLPKLMSREIRVNSSPNPEETHP